MSFISLTFAVFFAIFAALHFLSANLKSNALNAQKLWLFAASIAFYAWADLRFVPFLLYAIIVSYFGARFKRKAIFAAIVIVTLAPLLYFKYAPKELHPNIIFPLGISFFTFQSVSYLADCYKNKIQAELSLLNVALFISFFPIVSSGPIQRAQNLIPQFNKVHHFDYESATNGMKLFAWGMFKKLCVADRIAAYVNYVYGSAGDQHGCALLFATILYSFQIYCDFSGYSDMAIGAARFMGYDIGKNFDHPYLAQSVGDFWRRWHISLSTWLRDYVYIPLGGSRVALPRIYLNLIITFLVSGIWHGSTWNFVIWGALHGLFQCAGRAGKPALEKIKIPAFIKIAATFCLVTFAWIFFRAQDLPQAGTIITKFGQIPSELASFVGLKNSTEFKDAIKNLFALNNSSYGYIKGMLLTFANTIAFLIISASTQKKEGLKIVKTIPLLPRWILYIALTAIVLEASTSSANFIYQGF